MVPNAATKLGQRVKLTSNSTIDFIGQILEHNFGVMSVRCVSGKTHKLDSLWNYEPYHNYKVLHGQEAE